MNHKWIAALASLLLLGIILQTTGTRYKEPEAFYAPEGLIRLHVVANSDNTADQDLKRKVRDAIIRNATPAFVGAENIDAARVIARNNLNTIQEIACREIKAEGKEYPVKVELDSFAFPTKHYGPFVLPAGDYEAVRVVIGSGGGANWWCVLFPPLCFVDMSRNVAVSPPENCTPGIAATNPPAVAESSAEPAAPAMTVAINGENGAVPEETVTRVEYRFRILDLLENLAR